MSLWIIYPRLICIISHWINRDISGAENSGKMFFPGFNYFIVWGMVRTLLGRSWMRNMHNMVDPFHRERRLLNWETTQTDSYTGDRGMPACGVKLWLLVQGWMGFPETQRALCYTYASLVAFNSLSTVWFENHVIIWVKKKKITFSESVGSEVSLWSLPAAGRQSQLGAHLEGALLLFSSASFSVRPSFF